MNEPVTAEYETEILKIEKALDALITQMVEIDQAAAGEPHIPVAEIKFISAADVKVKTRRQAQINRLIENPVRGACKNAVHLLGERLYELTNDTDVSERIADRVAGERYFQHRVDILSKTWDGLGDWYA